MLVNGEPGNVISIRDRGLLYGDGVFRTMRANNGQVQHWPLHYQKLQHDCAALGMTCPGFAQLSAELEMPLHNQTDCAIKLIVTRGVTARGYAPSTRISATHIWDVAPLPDYPADWATTGIKARLCQLRLGQQPRLAGIKHLNRLENVLAASEWNDPDIAEGLLADTDGNIIEGVRSNLFAVLGDTLITPSLFACGVAGIQRDRVIAWAKSNKVPLEIRALSWDETINADELFVVNSLIGVWSIRELEQRDWANFPMAHRIKSELYGNGGTCAQ
jgi:4-amino-4-deoxychorismate lyase